MGAATLENMLGSTFGGIAGGLAYYFSGSTTNAYYASGAAGALEGILAGNLIATNTGGMPAASKVFTSSDPMVGDTANAVEQALPGAVKDVNVPIQNTELGLSSDADIMLNNGDVIEVKSGGGKGATTQVSNQSQIVGDSGEVIVYGPKEGLNNAFRSVHVR